MEHILMNGSNPDVLAIDYDGIIVIDGRNRLVHKIEPFYDEDGNKDLVVIYL
jgi:predicted GTPase